MSSTRNSSTKGSPGVVPALPKLDFIRGRSNSISSISSIGSNNSLESTKSVESTTKTVDSTQSVDSAASDDTTDSSKKKRKRTRPRKRDRTRSVSFSSDANTPDSLLDFALATSEEPETEPEQTVGHVATMETVADLEEEVIKHVPQLDRLNLMPTRKELKAAIETIDIYAVMIPSKSANDVLNIIRHAVPPTKSVLDLQHLRRLVRPENMPISVSGLPPLAERSAVASRSLSSGSSKFTSSAGSSRGSSCASSDGAGSSNGSRPSASEGSGSSAAKKRRRKRSMASRGDKPLFLLLCAVQQIELAALYRILAVHPLFAPGASSPAPTVTIHPVPLHPPSSQEQSDLLTEQFWPTVYRRGNPFGPHPSLVERMELKLMAPFIPDEHEGDIEDASKAPPSPASSTLPSVARHYMDLARQTADVGCDGGYGLRIGAIVVDMTENDAKGRVVAVAHDARGRGNPLGHAVMRVIALVGRKRVEVAGKEPVLLPFDINQPLTPIEETHFDEHQLQKDGYLMHNLHIYVTHEPCVMCSMALLHSRVGLIVFGKAMKSTGGIHSDLATKSTHDRMSDDEQTPEEFHDAHEYLTYATSSVVLDYVASSVPAVRSVSQATSYHDAMEGPQKEDMIFNAFQGLQVGLALNTREAHLIEMVETRKTEVITDEGSNLPDVAHFNPVDDYHTLPQSQPSKPRRHASPPPDGAIASQSIEIFAASKADDDDYMDNPLFGPENEQDNDNAYHSDTDITEPERGRSRIPVHRPGSCDGYGLFWRDKLNWKFLAWQWQDADIYGEEQKWPDQIGETINI